MYLYSLVTPIQYSIKKKKKVAQYHSFSVLMHL